MKRRNQRKRTVEERREEAIIRQEERDKLTELQQIKKLDSNNMRAEEERLRLGRTINKKDQNKKKGKKKKEKQ